MIERILLSAMVFGAVLALTLAYAGAWSALQARSQSLILGQERRHAEVLRDLFISELSPRQLTHLVLGGAVVAGLAVGWLTGGWLLAVLTGVGVLALPGPVLAYLRSQRLSRLEEQLPDAIDLLASSARAGLSLGQAIAEVAHNTQPPIAQEFDQMARDQRLGLDVGSAIELARKRIRSRMFGLVATALAVNRQKGGDLPEALERMSASLKEVWRLEQKVITASAEARKAAWFISAMPIFLAGMVMTFQPDMAREVTETAVGLVILTASAIIYALGLSWMRRVIRVDI